MTTTERADQVRVLVIDERLTFDKVAAHLGAPSRSAVASVAARNGITALPKKWNRGSPPKTVGVDRPVRSPRIKPDKAKRGRDHDGHGRYNGQPTHTLRDGPAFDPLEGSNPRHFLDRVSGQCRWPVGPDKLSCCEPTEGHVNYCPVHADRSRSGIYAMNEKEQDVISKGT